MSTTNVDDLVLPHSIEAELAVLGSVLLAKEAWPTAAALLTREDFFRDAHRRIWEAMARLAERGSSPADFVLLKSELVRTGELEEIGGPAYLSALVDGLPQAVNVEHYAGLVKEQARRRAVVFEANKLLAAAYEAEESADALVDAGVRALLTLASTPK